MKFTTLILSLSAAFIPSVWTAPAQSVSASASLSAKRATGTPRTYPISLEKQEQKDPIEMNDILNVVADNSLLSDMVQGGWSEEQAELVMSLLDAVDAMTEFPILSEGTNSSVEDNQEAFARFNALRADMNQLLAQAGYQYKTIGSRRRVLTRLDTSFAPNAAVAATEIEETGFHIPDISQIVHGIVSLIRSANEFTKLLNNPRLEDYTEAILDTAEMVEKILTFPKGGLFSDGHQ
ncbi:hypothetical protein BCR42DRAFT_427845 [Absidia repens]|uniref:Uncharacterized protein n=1 Tax=Absidia repens TaxID=90262 RepID=A0A1X2HZ55_9FUNG|nr:hypothetical protein BCR42DRAFT_427845 [Absidia repens]